MGRAVRLCPTLLDAGQRLFSGNWAWFGLSVVLWVFNTVLGEELLFRGLLLPRMNGVFGRGDWTANGLLFAAYHLHTPWVIPAALLDERVASRRAPRTVETRSCVRSRMKRVCRPDVDLCGVSAGFAIACSACRS